jgi:hypothetical protein
MVRVKRLLLLSLISSLLLVSTAAPGWTYPLKVVDVISLSNGPGTTNGGEFKVNMVSPLSSTDIFRTFCLERNEYFTWNQHLTIKGINDYATAGGVSGGGSEDKDYLSDETRYLYYHFYKGDLSGYNYSDSIERVNSANTLQEAIWMLEGEMTLVSTNYFIDYLNKSVVGSQGWTAGLDSVKVLNLFKPDGSKAQDQLTMVPEPGALLSLGIVLLGLGGVTRRRFKR